jgi:predicted dehydrogenase
MTSGTRYRYGIIGTGRPHGTQGATGFGMAHPHYHGFIETGRAELVAIADVREDNGRLFLDRYDSRAKLYADYREMLAAESLDIVSVCTWPAQHAEMVVAAAEAGVKAIHCEKPMATTWGDCKRMKAAADKNGTILTFDHQRRFLKSFKTARDMAQSGEVGELKRLEAQCGNMSDWGTHWLDMMFYYNNDEPAEWVLGQIDSRTEWLVYGALTENQAICQFKWRNGVRGLLVTGHDSDIGAANRIIGTEGTIELIHHPPFLRVWRRGDRDWQPIDTGEGLHGDVAIDRACADLVRALDEPGYRPLLSVDHAIQHSEVIFATYESSRHRGRIDLPLAPDDSALIAMTESGAIGPNRAAKE